MAQKKYRRGTRPNYRDEAFVLRHYDFGEADQVLVLLTPEHGIVRGGAKGIRKSRSRYGSRLGKFSKVNIQIYPSKDLASIGEVSSIQSYASALVDDVDKYYAANALIEIVEQLVNAVDPAVLFHTVERGFSELAQGGGVLGDSVPARVIVDKYVLELLSLAGWEPALVDCAQCGARGPHEAFNYQAGGAVCENCRPPGSVTPDQGVLRTLWWLSHGQEDRLLQAIEAEPEHAQNVLDQAHKLLAAYTRYHLESPSTTFSEL